MKRIVYLGLFAVAAAPLRAQAPAMAGPATGTAGAVWKQISGYVTQSAEDMPEAKYSFRATPEVRTFGQIIGHVAGSQYMYCAAALGDSMRAEDDIEKTKTSKADLVAAMKASNAYCAKAYAQTDMAVRAPITLFGQKQTRMYALIMNAVHDGEHYGNLVTYLRINGMVPPSSKGQ